MRNKYFTFLYIPSNNSEPRTLRVRRNFVYAGVVAIAIGLGAATWAVCKYSGLIRDTYRLAKVTAHNEQLQEQLTEFTREINVLQRQVAQNFDFQKKARLLANLEEMPDDVTEVGVGGPDYAYFQTITHLDKDTRERVLGARADIEKLLRQARLQRESYGEIMASLEETNEKLRSTPSLRPVNVGFISSRFGWRMDPVTGRRSRHRGIDFSARTGTPIFSTADGVVTFSGTWKTYGEVVEISHGLGYVTRYAHLQKRLVRKGQKVRRGDIIGRVGSSGKSTFSHLHYEVEKEGTRVDPMKFILYNAELPSHTTTAMK